MKDMGKTYLSPRIKTLKIQLEILLGFTSVNSEVGDGNQLGKEVELDGFDGEEGSYDESLWME